MTAWVPFWECTKKENNHQFWFHIDFKISLFVFHRRKICERESKEWHNFPFCLNYPFKKLSWLWLIVQPQPRTTVARNCKAPRVCRQITTPRITSPQLNDSLKWLVSAGKAERKPESNTVTVILTCDQQSSRSAGRTKPVSSQASIVSPVHLGHICESKRSIREKSYPKGENHNPLKSHLNLVNS